MRRYYLVTYDVRDPRRLRRVHKLLRSYGQAWQLSVFFCRLKQIDRIRLEVELAQEINQHEDAVLIVELGPSEATARKAITIIGPAPPEPEVGVIVV